MTQSSVVVEISRAAQALNPDQQQRVLTYIRNITTRPLGNRPADLISLAGSIPLEDCIEMQKAIEEGCEQVDHDGW
jgi:hypothetical protein